MLNHTVFWLFFWTILLDSPGALEAPLKEMCKATRLGLDQNDHGSLLPGDSNRKWSFQDTCGPDPGFMLSAQLWQKPKARAAAVESFRLLPPDRNSQSWFWCASRGVLLEKKTTPGGWKPKTGDEYQLKRGTWNSLQQNV